MGEKAYIKGVDSERVSPKLAWLFIKSMSQKNQ